MLHFVSKGTVVHASDLRGLRRLYCKVSLCSGKTSPRLLTGIDAGWASMVKLNGASWQQLNGFRRILFEFGLKISSKSRISHLSTPPISFLSVPSVPAVIVFTCGISTQVNLFID